MLSLRESMPVKLREIAIICLLVNVGVVGRTTQLAAQNADQLTPVQREIEKQRQRLSSSEPEERRDALMRLRNFHRADASRVGVAALNDEVPSVRVAAAHAIVYLPADEAAKLLLPLLQDKLEFIRREAAYALGETHSRTAVSALTDLLTSDKEMSVRAAAAFALGQIGDESAVPQLSQVVSDTPTGKKKNQKPDPFVQRAAAQALGQIRSSAAVSVLISTLSNDTNLPDIRREAAVALGVIGDSAAIPALREAYRSDDPYLSAVAREALRKMHATVKN